MATAPTLTTQIDPEGYQTEIDANFSAIQTSLIQICNELPSTTQVAAASNFSWIERALRSEGIGGAQSFTVTLDTDSAIMTVSHPGQNSLSWAIISSRYHYTTTEYSKTLSEIATVDGTYNCIVGLKSYGAPVLGVVISEDITDADYDLCIYTFTLHRSGTTYVVDNFRLATTLLMDGYTWAQELQSRTMQASVDGALPAAGSTGRGFVLPYAIEVIQADFYLAGAPPTSTVEARLVPVSNPTDGNVLNASASWTSGQSGLRSVSGSSPTTILDAGEFLEIDLASSDTSAENLTCVLTYQRVYHTL